MNILIRHGNVIRDDTVLKNTAVLIEGPKITAVGKKIRIHQGVEVVDACGLYLAPGFIDTHIHGNPDDIIQHETKYGTTAFVIAVSCGQPVADISNYQSILGIRLEGPYINPKMAGAQDRRFIQRIAVRTGSFKDPILRSHPKMVTLAPELSGANRLIRLCIQNGIIPSIGHSDASYAQAKRSFGAGIKHATHLFNAMSGPRHGTAGAGLAALFDKRVTIEIIADMVHVKSGLLRLLFSVKDKDKTILITDSVRAEKPSYPQSRGRLNVPYGRGHMIDCVKNVVTHCGVSLSDAIKMASSNPARLFGFGGSKGVIAPGRDADLVAFDKNFNVKFVIIGGKIVYQKKGLH